jgi:predicted nucleic acid-binding protein
MITTLPVLTEVLYLLQIRAGWKSQSLVFRLIHDGRLKIADLTSELIDRTEDLMAKYEELPMDFADASLVVVAEDRNIKQIFTLDDHFNVYRLKGREPFEVIPSPT